MAVSGMWVKVAGDQFRFQFKSALGHVGRTRREAGLDLDTVMI